MTKQSCSKRRRYLSSLVSHLRAKGCWKLGVRFHDKLENGIEGCILRFSELPGKVHIVPILLDRSTRVWSWRPFPSGGVPHYEMYFYPDESTDEFLEHAIAHDETAASNVLSAWVDQFNPKLRGTALPMSVDEVDFVAEIYKRVDCIGARDVHINQRNRPPAKNADQFAKTLKCLDLVQIARNFPRDKDGRLTLNTVVLLECYEASLQMHRDRLTWLIARSPARRGDPQVIDILLSKEIGANRAHNWSDSRWLWDTRSQSVPRLKRWRVPIQAVRQARFGNCPTQSGAEAISKLKQPAKITQSLLMLDQAKFVEAFKLFDVRLDPQVCQFLLREADFDGWTRSLRIGLWQSAPWLFKQTLEHERRLISEWCHHKPGRKVRLPRLKLFNFPGQSTVTKTGLFLLLNDQEQTTLSIDRDATHQILAEHRWKRPLALDWIRFGLMPPRNLS